MFILKPGSGDWSVVEDFRRQDTDQRPFRAFKVCFPAYRGLHLYMDLLRCEAGFFVFQER